MKKVLAMLVFNFALFFVLAPHNFFALPAGGDKFTVSATHAAVFAVANLVLYGVVKKMLL
jgi:hypothetical protein